MKLTFEAEQYMSFGTPMVSQITGAVLNHPNPDIPKIPGLPISNTVFPGVFSLLNFRPVCNPER
jgi:hypothetical protein